MHNKRKKILGKKKNTLKILQQASNRNRRNQICFICQEAPLLSCGGKWEANPLWQSRKTQRGLNSRLGASRRTQRAVPLCLPPTANWQSESFRSGGWIKRCPFLRKTPTVCCLKINIETDLLVLLNHQRFWVQLIICPNRQQKTQKVYRKPMSLLADDCQHITWLLQYLRMEIDRQKVNRIQYNLPVPLSRRWQHEVWYPILNCQIPTFCIAESDPGPSDLG